MWTQGDCPAWFDGRMAGTHSKYNKNHLFAWLNNSCCHSESRGICGSLRERAYSVMELQPESLKASLTTSKGPEKSLLENVRSENFAICWSPAPRDRPYMAHPCVEDSLGLFQSFPPWPVISPPHLAYTSGSIFCVDQDIMYICTVATWMFAESMPSHD